MAMSSVSRSVTRSPRTNLGATPCFAAHSVMNLPPPWTTTGCSPSRHSWTRSGIVESWSPSVEPPIFTTIGLSVLMMGAVCWQG